VVVAVAVVGVIYLGHAHVDDYVYDHQSSR